MVQLGVFGRSGYNAVKILLDHRHATTDEIAQIVSQIRIDTLDQRLIGELAVRTERHLAHEEIAHCIRRIPLAELHRIDDVSLGLTHFAAAHDQPAVAKHLFGQRQAESVQHNRPDNRMETHNFLAYQMNVRRPILLEQGIVFRAIPQRIDVVGQRVHPHIHSMFRIEINRNAPFKRCAGNAQILKTRNQKVVEHFSRPRRRLDEIGMGLNVINQPILILGKTEEIALLAGLLHRTAAIRTAAIFELKLRPEGLTGRAIPALILTLVNIALIMKFAEDLLYGLHMALVRRADKVRVINIHQLPELLDAIYDVIDIFLRRHAGVARLALDLLTMLIRSSQEENIIARHLLKAGHRVRRSRTVAMADMQIIARIINRRCDVERRFLAHPHLSFKKTPPACARGDCLCNQPWTGAAPIAIAWRHYLFIIGKTGRFVKQKSCFSQISLPNDALNVAACIQIIGKLNKNGCLVIHRIVVMNRKCAVSVAAVCAKLRIG